jgi:hypothetical protein
LFRAKPERRAEEWAGNTEAIYIGRRGWVLATATTAEQLLYRLSERLYRRAEEWAGNKEAIYIGIKISNFRY